VIPLRSVRRTAPETVDALIRAQGRHIRAKYDAAQTTQDNRRHWAGADNLAADASNNAQIRRILRSRARYEVANNSYARGIVLTLANDVIGTGPTLQMLTADADVNRQIEREFARWATAVGLAEKLRTMRVARAQDGESFGILFTNEALPTTVKLDLRLIESDQVATPSLSPFEPNAVDGIVLDQFGSPVEYHVLRQHPGSVVVAAMPEYDRFPADSVIHWFRCDRPGQHRGVPDITPALPLFAQLRRYTLAVIDAAESAANWAIIMKTTAPPGGEAAEMDPGVTMEVERNMAVFAPEGWEPSQMKAEQPATGYGEFKREILNEIARCLNMPYNIAACNSSQYNYASGRLDHQTYYKSIRVEQDHIEAVVLDRILRAWLVEATMAIEDLHGIAAERADGLPHQWFWDGHEHVDPAKEANAQETRLRNNTTTLAIEYARQGLDWEEQLRQRAKEVALMKELGLPTALAPSAPKQNADDKEEVGALPE
jgi:lambda family phage portal protein